MTDSEEKNSQSRWLDHIPATTMFELYPDATVLIDLQTGLPEAFNQVAHEQLGYSAREFSRLRITDYEARESPAEIEKHIEYIKKHGRDDFETGHRRKDESIIDVHVTVMLFEIKNKGFLLCVFRDITDRKSAHRALEKSEQRFRDVAEAAGEYIWEIDSRGIYTFLTPRAEELFGRKVEEILGRSPFDFMPSEEAARVEKLLAEWAEKEETWQSLEHQTLRADGKIVWQRVSGIPILDLEGKLHGFRGTGLDISAEIEARQEQQRLASRLQLATDAAKLGIWDLRLSDGYLEWDEGMFRIYGLSREKFTNSVDDWLNALMPEFKEQAPKDIQRGIASGRPYDSEFKIRRGDGEVRHIRAMAQPILDGQDSPVRVVGINEDVTESKQAEERLHEQERLYRGLVESQQDLIVRVDGQGRFTYVNDAYCRKFGKTREELVGRSFTPLVHEDDLQTTMQAMKDLEHPPYRAYIEQRAYTNEGWRWLSWEDSALLDENGAVQEIQGVGRDITELKEAQRQAEAASRSKSEFLANMSHEIRTPMNAVVGLIQLLLQTPLNDRQRDYMHKINSSSRMLLGIINDILDYSKIEAGKLELDIHNFRMEELLDQMKTLFASAAAEKGLDIFFRIDPDVPGVLRTDSLRLGQVFTNLLGNAIKFTEKGHVELVVRRTGDGEQNSENGKQDREVKKLDPGERETVRLRFEVHDTGIGMDKEQTGRLFQAFSQADTSTTRKYGGTGLGLVISQKLVQRMGGELKVQSDPGRGSSFSFELDLPAFWGEDSQSECRGIDKGKILVVDDHATARLVLRDILESCSFQVDEAESGQAAVDAVVAAEKSGDPFDYIFMDWKMPGEIDGVEAVKKIEKLYSEEVLKGTNPPAVIVSAYKRDELPEEAGQCFNCFLSKPITASSVFDALAQAGGKAPSVQHNFTQAEPPSFAGCSVLLAEDNLLNQEVAQELVQKTGARVTVAGNGAEAVQMVENGDFDLVLMDLQMPVMDGFQASRKILHGFPDMPIIALSAAVMEEDRKQSKQAGMLDHVAKPIDSAELYRTLARWLPLSQESSKPREESPAGSAGLPDYLEGFDLDQGRRSFDGDDSFYLKMLHRFNQQLHSEFASMDEHLQGEGNGDGPRLVHTLKGLAGTVGASRLAAAAKSIDHAFKKGEEITPEMRRELLEAMDSARDQLAGLPPLAVPEQEVDAERGAAAMIEIFELLKKNEMVDDELLTFAVQFLQTRLGREKSAEFASLVENFEYDAAASMLLQLAADAGVDIK